MTPEFFFYAAWFILGCCAGNAVFDAEQRRWSDLALDLAGVVACVGALVR